MVLPAVRVEQVEQPSAEPAAREVQAVQEVAARYLLPTWLQAVQRRMARRYG